ncbi:MAG: hypothetical protein SFX19_02280 [Alphaproteobacteria bacterium]|nr:hypothetical protein [Alphaproteobacteria bacterium]
MNDSVKKSDNTDSDSATTSGGEPRPASSTASSASGAGQGQGMNRTLGGEQKSSEGAQNPALAAEQVQRNIELMVQTIVHKLGLTSEVAEHAIAAANGAAKAVNDMAIVTQLTVREISKVAGIPALAQLGQLPSQALNNAQQQARGPNTNPFA